jgi:hypothetical protein
MPRTFHPQDKEQNAPSFHELWQPVEDVFVGMPPLEARGNKPLQLNFEHQLKSLVFFHLEEHTSGRHLLQVLEEDDFAREVIAPPAGIKKSSFFEAINSRGLEQLTYVFQQLQAKAAKILPREHAELGNLVAIDGSLIDAVLSMHWADYRNDSKKAKVHLGFDINQSIPSKLFFTDGKADERPFVSQILLPGQTGVMDRYYQCHKDFDLWQTEGKYFACRIRENTKKTCIKSNAVKSGSIVFYDAMVLLGTPGVNQTEKELRVVGYRIDNKEYWIATNRYDLSAEEIATIYKLRWNIEIFFGWWKRHLKVYHLIARSKRGLMAQILGGLITYLLLAIYCHEHYKEKVSIKRVRELRIKIQNEARNLKNDLPNPTCQQTGLDNHKEQQWRSFAIT